MAGEEEDLFECPVCLEQMEDPVTLGCGHSGCKGCLKEALKASAGGRLCPVCRTLHRGQLNTNIALQRLAQKCAKDRQRDLPADPPSAGDCTDSDGLERAAGAAAASTDPADSKKAKKAKKAKKKKKKDDKVGNLFDTAAELLSPAPKEPEAGEPQELIGVVELLRYQCGWVCVAIAVLLVYVMVGAMAFGSLPKTDSELHTAVHEYNAAGPRGNARQVGLLLADGADPEVGSRASIPFIGRFFFDATPLCLGEHTRTRTPRESAPGLCCDSA